MSAANNFTGTMRDGEFIPDDPAGYARALSRKDGTRMVMTVKRFVPKRSNDANAFWWACVIPLFQEEMGIDDKYRVHEIVLMQIGHCEIREVFGRQARVAKPTRDLPADEFRALIEKAERLFAEYFGGRFPKQDSPQAQAMMQGA
jgi:hypothetical protein